MSAVFRRMDIAKLQFSVYVGGDIGGVGVLKGKKGGNDQASTSNRNVPSTGSSLL